MQMTQDCPFASKLELAKKLFNNTVNRVSSTMSLTMKNMCKVYLPAASMYTCR